MHANQCRRLRSMLTAYVDDEVSAADRPIVEDHLRQCHGCRDRVSRERAVRHRLRDWSAEASVEGTPLVSPVASRTGPSRGLSALLGVAALLAAMAVVGLVIGNRDSVDTGELLAARGQISDSRCAGGHAHEAPELRNMSSRDCVTRCIETGAQYVFVSQGVVHTIRNQDFADLARLAGQEVELEGEMRQHLLTVTHLRPLAVSRSNDEGVWRAPGRREYARTRVGETAGRRLAPAQRS